jgi:hypothetical protein
MNTALAINLPVEFLLTVAAEVIRQYELQDFGFTPEQIITEDDPARMRELILKLAKQQFEREEAEREAAKQTHLKAVRLALEQRLAIVPTPELEVTPLQESPPAGPTENRAVIVSPPTSILTESKYIRRQYPLLPDVCFVPVHAVENSMAVRGIFIRVHKRLMSEKASLSEMAAPWYIEQAHNLIGKLSEVLNQLKEYLEEEHRTDVHNPENFARTETFALMNDALRRDDRTSKFFRTFVAQETDASSDETMSRSVATSTSGGRAAADARKRDRSEKDRAQRLAMKGNSGGGGGKNHGGKKKK